MEILVHNSAQNFIKLDFDSAKKTPLKCLSGEGLLSKGPTPSIFFKYNKEKQIFIHE